MAAVLAIGTLLGALLLTFALLLLTQTAPGRAWLCRQINQALAEHLVGRVHLGDFRLRLGWTPRLRLLDVRVANTSGDTIASASALALTLRLPALLTGHVQVTSLDARGLIFNAFTPKAAPPTNSNSVWEDLAGIFNAFAPRTAQTPTARPGRSSAFLSLIRRLRLSIERGRVEGRSLSFRDVVRLDELAIQFSADLRASRFELRLAAEGALKAPVTGPLAIDLKAHGVPWTRARLEQLNARLGHSRLNARGDWQRQKANLIVEALHLDTGDLGPSRPSLSRLGKNLEASGAAMWRAGGVDAVVQGRIGALSAQLDGHWRGESGTRLGLGRGRVSLEHAALGKGQGMRAQIDLWGDRLELADLDLSLDGARLVGQGALSLPPRGDRLAPQLDLALTIGVSSLEQLALALEQILDRRLPAMTGAGNISARFSGPISPPQSLPAVQMNARFDHLASGAFRLADAALDLNASDLARPQTLTAALSVPRAHLGPLRLRALSARLQADGYRLHAHLGGRHASHDAPIALALAARLSPDLHALRVDRLSLTLPRHAFELARPATLRLVDGLSVDRLLLTSGPQSLSLVGGLEQGAFSWRLQARQIDLAALTPWLWPSLSALTGRLDVDAEVTGTREQPKAQLRLNARDAAFHPNWPHFDADLDADFSQSMALSLSLALPHGAIDLTAHLDASPSIALDHLRQARAQRLLNRPMSLWARWQGLDLGDFSAIWPGAHLRGQVDGTLSLSGTRQRPRGELKFDLRKAHLRRGGFQTPMALDLSLGLRLKRTRLELVADMAAAQKRLMRLDAALDCDVPRLLARRDPLRQLGKSPLTAALHLGPIALEQWPRASPFATGTIDARARLDGTLDAPRLSLQGALRDFWLGPEGVGVLRFEGGYLDGRLSLQTRLLRLDKIRPADLAPRFIDVVEQSLRAPPATLGDAAPERPPVISLDAMAHASVSLSPWSVDWPPTSLPAPGNPQKPPFQIDLSINDLDLAWLTMRRASQPRALTGRLPHPVSNPVSSAVSGRLDAALCAHGTLTSPWIDGSVRLRDGTLSLGHLGRLRDIDASVDFTGRALRLTHLSARSGQGTLSLQGTVQWPTPDRVLAVEAALALVDLPLSFRGLRLGDLTCPGLHLTGTLSPRDIALRLDLDQLAFRLIQPSLGKELQALSPHRAIDIRHSRQARRDPHAPPAKPPPNLALALRARAIEITSRDLKLGATADLSWHRHGHDNSLRGVLRATHGKATLLGRVFELESARLIWLNEPPHRPGIDATVLHDNAREGIQTRLTLSGHLPRPHLTLTSRPPHNERDLALLIATGRLNQRRDASGIDATQGATAILGSFFVDRLRRALFAPLPIDVLRFDLGEGGLDTSRLEVGAFLGEDLYLSYQRDFGADPARENVDAVRLELQLTPHLSLESIYGQGDEGRGGGGVIFHQDY